MRIDLAMLVGMPKTIEGLTAFQSPYRKELVKRVNPVFVDLARHLDTTPPELSWRVAHSQP
jgi:hypothetical protein